MVDDQYKHILVAYDGSVSAEKALKKAVNVAKRNTASLSVVYVTDLRSPQMDVRKSSQYEEILKEHEEKMKETIMELIEASGLKNYQIKVERGNPKTVITYDLIDQIGADMIICGSNGLDSYDQLVMGSTSENIVRYSSVDVLVVK
ncbi:universal stress protein [Salisediminibacterium halotolerans]|uniref:Universal stress protein n=1 Tax=Salisediminibacterium halotolerans TaxID=517425 RepID=A0A1H9UWH0_9BACI|nr:MULTISPECIES: universal stress protein [Salisediminibacterium]RLJ80882.1 nucleotide-binding universal stress UspA family protein [Actinophytocola xinjiangensis]RPE83932.1 nucleotide-binding universal stress UspA family protein [Salisediminibacterium halotolerans]TWG37826.1 nucleotide-binding universal stress UspA family protein [Salisediminibacterium halotolerans]SES13689.1 Nucleotide-binding universal stress protein, UspA family [Salisediminibacterium haloalkalitolerans]GEL09047.1 universa